MLAELIAYSGARPQDALALSDGRVDSRRIALPGTMWPSTFFSALTGFDTSNGLSSFTPGSGWTGLVSDPGSGFDSDYRLNPTSASTVSESPTSGPQTSGRESSPRSCRPAPAAP
jgi:hypothetical protein